MQGTQEMPVWFLGWEDPLKEEMATHSNIVAWKIPWTEEPGGLQNTKYSLLWGCEKSDTTKHTHTLTQTHTEGLRNFLRWYIDEGCSWDSDTGLLALWSGTTALQDAPCIPEGASLFCIHPGGWSLRWQTWVRPPGILDPLDDEVGSRVFGPFRGAESVQRETLCG